MSTRRFITVPRLEKLKAALGAAGMAAMAMEAFGPRLLGSFFNGIAGSIAPIAVAVISAIAASYWTDVSANEASLQTQAAKHGTSADASRR